MSAYTNNYVFLFGKKKKDAGPEPVITKERLEEARKTVERLMANSKKK